jgi:N-acetylglucosamine-6-phosphate deacetylase
MKKGAHNPDNIKAFPNGFSDVVDVYGDLNNVAMVTLAPELDRSGEVIHELCKRGIKVSLGNSNSYIGLQYLCKNHSQCIHHDNPLIKH